MVKAKHSGKCLDVSETGRGNGGNVSHWDCHGSDNKLWANVYLNELDHHLKDVFQVEYYIRYMDDFVVFHENKRYLRDLLDEITEYLDSPLRLSLNRKTQIFPIWPRSVDFLGYRIWPGHRLLRKSNVRRTKRKLHKFERLYSAGFISIDKINPSAMSWLGHAMCADTYRLRKTFLAELVFTRAKRPSRIPKRRCL